jgi:hypothetical protein
MTMKMRISRKVEVSFELVAWDSKGVKATWLKPNDEIVTRSRPETSSTDGWAYMMNLFQQILWVQTNHAMSNCGVDLEVDPSPDWKPVKLVTNCNRHVDELGNDSGSNGRPRSTRTEACRRDESDPNRRSLQWSIWLVMKAWINVSIDSWWAIDALLATDVSGSNKLSIFRSAIHAIHDELQVQVNSKVVHDVTPLQDGADGLHVTLSMEVVRVVTDPLWLVIQIQVEYNNKYIQAASSRCLYISSIPLTSSSWGRDSRMLDVLCNTVCRVNCRCQLSIENKIWINESVYSIC